MYSPMDIDEFHRTGDVGRVEIYRCPFCNRSAPAHLPLSKVIEGGTSETSFTCTRCGRITVRNRLLDQDTMLLAFGLPGSKLLAREKEVVSSMNDLASEASKILTYGVLGGFAKSTIKEEFARLEKIEPDKTDQVFEETLRKILDLYEMKFCLYCNRFVKRIDSFCGYCGKALI